MSPHGNQPIKVDILAGETKAICTCEKSGNFPYCDGSHRGTGLSPQIITADADKTLHVCACGKSNNKPNCDGSHAK